MMTNRIVTIAAFCVYLIFMLCIGMYFVGKNKTTTEYFLGGRKLGSWVTSMSAQASDMSGWLLMGLPGAAYLSGISAGWIGIGLAIGTYLNWLLVAKPLRQYTKVAGDAITLPEYFNNRFHDESGSRSFRRYSFWYSSCSIPRPASFPAQSCSRPFSASRIWYRSRSAQSSLSRIRSRAASSPCAGPTSSRAS